jgi:hypothetical protein
MRKRTISSIALLLVVLSGLVAWPQYTRAAARTPDEVPPTLPPYSQRLFPETGHYAVNSFQQLWERTPNNLFVLGYPISQPFIEESFTNPGEYYRVQYYERAVLEEHPENAGSAYYILGRLMGTELAKGREDEAPFQPVGNPGDGTWDEFTEHTLRDGPAPFRSFWLNNGGLSSTATRTIRAMTPSSPASRPRSRSRSRAAILPTVSTPSSTARAAQPGRTATARCS